MKNTLLATLAALALLSLLVVTATASPPRAKGNTVVAAEKAVTAVVPMPVADNYKDHQVLIGTDSSPINNLPCITTEVAVRSRAGVTYTANTYTLPSTALKAANTLKLCPAVVLLR